MSYKFNDQRLPKSVGHDMQHLSVSVRRTGDQDWIASVEQNPSLHAYGKTYFEALARTQAISMRWMAEQLEQGQMAPLEFSMAIAANTQTYGLAYQKAVALLDGFDSVTGQPSDQRVAIMKSIAAIQDLLETMGISARLRIPFLLLVSALRDLDHGTVDPILQPSSRSQNKPTDPTRAWAVRASLAAALEVCVCLGMSLSEGAAKVAKDAKKFKLRVAGAKRDNAPSAARIIQLRKDFRSKRAGPSQGLHINTWELYSKMAKDCAAKLEPIRTEHLNQLYAETLLSAGTRGALTKG